MAEIAAGNIDEQKKRKEVEKLEIEIQNAKRYVSLEKRKIWASFFGPLATAVTIVGTVYAAFLQVSSKSQSDEDGFWRQTLELVDSKAKDLDSLHLGSLLAPFLESKRYHAFAKDVVIDILPRIRNEGTFRELYTAIFAKPDPEDVIKIMAINRQIVTMIYSPDASVAAPAFTAAVPVLRILCEPLSKMLRNADQKMLLRQAAQSRGSDKLDLAGIDFESCDLSGVDFSDINLGNATLDQVIVDDAILKDMSSYGPYVWDNIVWWRARFVDQSTLTMLLRDYKPYVFHLPNDAYRSDANITEKDWNENIVRLCKSVGMTCTPGATATKFPQ
jgi:hypothetical protein